MSLSLLRVVFLILVLPSVTQAQSGPAFDALGPRGIALGEALRAGAGGSIATKLNPAGVALVRNYVVEAAVGMRSEDEAKTIALSICDSVTSRVGACLYYDYVFAEGRSLHHAGIAGAIPIGDRILFGVTNKWVEYSEDASEDAAKSGLLVDAGLLVKISSMINLALVGYNLVGGDDAQFKNGFGTGISVNATPHLAVSADGRWNFDESGRYGAGVEYFVGTQGGLGYPLRAGYVYDDSTGGSFLTGGLGIVSQRFALDGGIRKQVDGGEEMMLQIGLRFFVQN